MPLLTLHEFGKRAECDYTTASRLLSGDRMPSTRLLARICTAFDLDHGEALRTLEKDQKRDDGHAREFARYLKDRVFGGADAPDAESA